MCHSILAASIIADTAGKTKTKGDKTKGKGKGAATQETEVRLAAHCQADIQKHIVPYNMSNSCNSVLNLPTTQT